MKVISKSGKEEGDIELPVQFSEEYRPDLIKKAFLVQQSHSLTPYGTTDYAGMRHSTRWAKARQTRWRTTYNWGISRSPRKIMARIGGGFLNVMRFHTFRGAEASFAVGGRKAHPPKSIKVISKKINTRERKKAIRSAISATVMPEIVKKRGHKIGDKALPLIVSAEFEKVGKTKEIVAFLRTIGLGDELLRAAVKKVRAGKGKWRGRKYKKRKGPLFVVSSDCELMKSARNIPGCDAVIVNKLNVGLLAPGAMPGRLVIWTETSINKMKEENLFR